MPQLTPDNAIDEQKVEDIEVGPSNSVFVACDNGMHQLSCQNSSGRSRIFSLTTHIFVLLSTLFVLSIYAKKRAAVGKLVPELGIFIVWEPSKFDAFILRLGEYQQFFTK